MSANKLAMVSTEGGPYDDMWKHESLFGLGDVLNEGEVVGVTYDIRPHRAGGVYREVHYLLRQSSGELILLPEVCLIGQVPKVFGSTGEEGEL